MATRIVGSSELAGTLIREQIKTKIAMAHYVHKELKEGEVWVFNSRANEPLPFNKDGKLKTMRFGKQALDIHGKKISPEYMLPVYIHKSELDMVNKRWGEELAAVRRGEDV